MLFNVRPDAARAELVPDTIKTETTDDHEERWTKEGQPS